MDLENDYNNTKILKSCDSNSLSSDKNYFLQRLPNMMFLICPPFIISLNVLVLIIAFKYAKLKQHFDQWFVINMASANLIYGLVYLVVGSPHADMLPTWLCKPYYVITWACTASSVFFLLLLNVHKFITLFMPYYAPRLISKRMTILQVGAVWILVLAYCIGSAVRMNYVLQEDENEPCYTCRVQPDPYLHVVMITVFYIMPLLLSLIISICIFVLAQKKGRYSPAGVRTEEASDKRMMFKRIVFVFSYTVCNALTILPFRFCYSYRMFCVFHTTVDGEPKPGYDLQYIRAICWPPSLELAVPWLMALIPLVSAFNPIITIGTQKTYRSGLTVIYTYFKQVFSKICCCSTLNKGHAPVAV